MGQEDAFQLIYLSHPSIKQYLIILSRLLTVNQDMGAEPVIYLALTLRKDFLVGIQGRHKDN